MEEDLSYEESLKYYRDLKNSLDTDREEGKMEGLKEGKMEGLKEGELKAKKEVVKNLLKNGVLIEVIQQVTGFSKEEIEELN